MTGRRSPPLPQSGRPSARTSGTAHSASAPGQAQARFSRPGAPPRRVPFPAGGRPRARVSSRDVRRATPDVTGACVVAAGLPSAAAPGEGVAAAGRSLQGVARPTAATRTTTRTPGAATAQSPLPPLRWSLAAPARGFLLFLPCSPRASGPRRREAPRAPRRPGRPRRPTRPPPRPARAPCEGGTGLPRRPAPDSSRAPPAPGDPAVSPDQGPGDRPRGDGGAGSAAAAAPRACGPLRPRGTAASKEIMLMGEPFS
nr:uncharacterized protein LOC109730965 [Microcebus murinus]